MKFHDFCRPRLNATVGSRPFRGSGGMLPQKIIKIRTFNLAENEFQTKKFPDFWNSVANSLTFRGLFQIPWLFQVFQVSGNPANFKYEDSKNTKADCVKTVVFNLHQFKCRAFLDIRYIGKTLKCNMNTW